MDKSRRRQMRWLLFGQQDGRCFYCDQPMALSFAARDNIWGNSATIEHLQRKVEGGGNGRANLVLACRTCNERRGERDWREYKLARSDKGLA